MGEIKLSDEALKAAVEIVKEPTGNILSEPTKEIGEGIASFVNLVFSPFRYGKQKASIYFAHKLEVYEKELVEKEKSIPEDKRVEPDFHTVSLALENSKFCITNDDIRHMFVNLIGCSINSDKISFVHPAYAEVLKQMTSVDAHIVRSFQEDEAQPLIEVRLNAIDSEEYRIVFSNVYHLEGNESISDEELMASISNLCRLGIIEITYIRCINDDQVYIETEAAAEKMSKDINPDGYEKIFKKGAACLTLFGSNFIRVCLPDPELDQ